MSPDVVITRPRINPCYPYITCIEICEVNFDPPYPTGDTNTGSNERPRGSLWGRISQARIDIYAIPIALIASTYIHPYLLDILDAANVDDNPVPLGSIVSPICSCISIYKQCAGITCLRSAASLDRVWLRPDSERCSGAGASTGTCTRGGACCRCS